MSVIFNSDMNFGNEVYKKHFLKVAQCSLAMFKINIIAFVKENYVSLQSLCSNIQFWGRGLLFEHCKKKLTKNFLN